ncbi:hypothetical protein [Pararhizobium sp.]|uniref:hypothetical protein n=1 Tax=Pararhizobium sp. TaxID=1977563 RepID=UPI002726667C|nr:hypothetical protein [Pararhizobium sp.]MDO9417990.1 hypothetical protein [Pararhizobium sp.]
MTVLAVRICVSLFAVSVILTGCGTTGGARAVGGLLGKTAPSAQEARSAGYIAALQGGVVARAGGANLSKADQQRALEAEYRALEAAPGGQPVTWEGRGVNGSVVAAAPYQVGSQNCRQYSHTLTIGAQATTARGAACRNGDGTWTPLS